jgi:hypothetical protein
VSRLTGWIVAGTIALTGALSEVAAQALPGHHKRATPASTPRSQPSDRTAPAAPSPSNTESDPSSANDPSSTTPDLQPPEQVPAPSAASGGAVSGGS